MGGSDVPAFRSKIEADALYRQAYWEQDMATRGYDKTLVNELQGGEYSKSALNLKKKLFGRLLTPVKAFYEESVQAVPSGRDFSNDLLLPFMMCSPEQTTANILTWLVSYPYRADDSNTARMMAVTKQGVTVGRLVVDTASFNRALRSVETGRQFKALLEESKRSRSAKFRLQALYKEWRNEVDNETVLKVGSFCISLAVKTFPEYLELQTIYQGRGVGNGGKQHNVVVKTQAWWDLYQTQADKVAMASPTSLPTIIPPKPWSRLLTGEASNGGYYFMKRALVRNVSHSVKPVFKLSDRSLNALNHAQNTAWVLNKKVLNVVQGVIRNEVLLPGAIPVLSDKPTTEEVGAFSEFQRTLGAAEEVADRPSLWFPKSYDWRLRLYDLPNDLKPQGNDFARGLLMFAHGLPVSLNGRYWLAVHLGNLLGKDKAQYPDRIKAVEDATDLIQRIVSDPLKNREWAEMEDPWQFLAACYDWVAINESDKARSHIPVSLDGSCSGMQHFSMLTRDYKGALATNCTSDERIHDLYLAVGGRVKDRVEYDAAKGVKQALLWWEMVSNPKQARGVCKRAVMTVPYGVTDRGITQFMIKDKHVAAFPKEDRYTSAVYMTTLIRAALDDTMSNARAAQAYINTVAYTLALKQKPLAWETPAGSIVAQGYKNLIEKRVKTPNGTLTLHVEPEDASYDHRRAKLATSPNVIHSLDAAHLQLVVNDLAAEGINDMFLVHDSFGVHAENVPLMRNILRAKLHEIYKDNQLEAWRSSVERLSGERLPEPPPVGDWDVSEVLNAEYLFA